jgi:hypothetical protein
MFERETKKQASEEETKVGTDTVTQGTKAGRREKGRKEEIRCDSSLTTTGVQVSFSALVRPVQSASLT